MAVEFRREHPHRLRLIARVLGWDLAPDAAVRGFVRTHPFVALRPAAGGALLRAGDRARVAG